MDDTDRIEITVAGLAYSLGRMARTAGACLPVVRAALVEGWEDCEGPSTE